MTLKFIGANGSMGLKKGQTYDVELYTHNGFFWVQWKLQENCFGKQGLNRCPYRSTKTFAENWALLNTKG